VPTKRQKPTANGYQRRLTAFTVEEKQVFITKHSSSIRHASVCPMIIVPTTRDGDATKFASPTHLFICLF